MKILWSTLAVIVGYAIFVVSALVLFKVFRIDPDGAPGISVLVAVIAWRLSSRGWAALWQRGSRVRAH